MGSGERKEAKKLTGQQVGIANQTLDLGKQLTGLAMPWLSQAGNYYSDVTKGGRSMEKAMAPQVNAVSNQYTAALRNMQNSLPPGGQRDRALRDWSISRANSIGGVYSGGVSEALDRLANLGGSGIQTGMSGYNSASQGYGQAAGNYTQMANGKAQAWGSLGGGLGSIASMGMGGLSGGKGPKSV